MKIHNPKNYVTLFFLSGLGFLNFFISLYILTFVHSKYFYLDEFGKYFYKDIAQKGDYEFLLMSFGFVCFFAHVIILIILLCEILLKRDLIIQKTKVQNKIHTILFYLGILLNITPYIISRLLEFFWCEFLINLGLF